VKSQFPPISQNSQAASPPFFLCPFNRLRKARLLQLESTERDVTYRLETDDSIMLSDLRKVFITMLTSILGARLSWHFANGWVFEPAIVGPDIVDYTLKEGPHAGRHAIQHFYFQRVAPGVETTVWYEESGALVHITWYLETQTVHRFAALPAWLAEDMTVYRGDNQDPAFIEKIRKLSSSRQDWPRHILNDEGYFKEI
jgi:phenolic acid decarboxylase